MEIRAQDLTPSPSIIGEQPWKNISVSTVSLKETAISVRREGKRVWRGTCASDPRIIANLIRKRAPAAKRVVFETGPLSVWFYHSLRAEKVPAICIDARHAKAALDMAPNKTDANDADGLAHLAEVGFFQAVRVKGFDSVLTRTLVAARARLARITTELQPDPWRETVTVAGRNRRGDEVSLTIRQPDGTLAHLPIWMTEDQAKAMMMTERPRLPLAYLHELRLELDACLTLAA